MNNASTTSSSSSSIKNEIESSSFSGPDEILFVSSCKGITEIVKFAIQIGANVNSQDYNDSKCTALMKAIRNGHEHIVQTLLHDDNNTSLDLNIQNNYGYTALMFAANNNNSNINEYVMTKIVLLLVQKKKKKKDSLSSSSSSSFSCFCDLDIQDKYGRTALMFSSMNGYKAITQILITSNANLNIQDNKIGWTALMYVASSSSSSSSGRKRNDSYNNNNGYYDDIVKLLIENNANLNIRENKFGSTALMQAIYYDNESIGNLLINNNTIDLNIQDKFGMTALIWASRCGRINTVQLLLDTNNLDINIQTITLHTTYANINTTYKGSTALMEAERKGHKQIVQMLLNYNKKSNNDNNNTSSSSISNNGVQQQTSNQLLDDIESLCVIM